MPGDRRVECLGLHQMIGHRTVSVHEVGADPLLCVAGRENWYSGASNGLPLTGANRTRKGSKLGTLAARLAAGAPAELDVWRLLAYPIPLRTDHRKHEVMYFALPE
jgi:hypothetical protein